MFGRRKAKAWADLGVPADVLYQSANSTMLEGILRSRQAAKAAKVTKAPEARKKGSTLTIQQKLGQDS